MTDTLTPPTPEFDVQAIIEEPLWRVRLRLGWRAFRRNWALFSDNKMGIVGLAIIAVFGVMALSHPILMNTVWANHLEGGKNVYDIRAGADSIMRGMSRLVRRKWPSRLVASVLSMPSGVSDRSTNSVPALLTST